MGLGEGCRVRETEELPSDLATLGGKTFSQLISYFSFVVADFQIQLMGH